VWEGTVLIKYSNAFHKLPDERLGAQEGRMIWSMADQSAPFPCDLFEALRAMVDL
jgi:hypothetical protein